MAQLTIAASPEELAVIAADRVTGHVGEAIIARGNALVCLTGGNTPRRLYTLLGDPDRQWRERIDWDRLHLFWTDERHVPPDHPESNFGMTRECLLSRVPVPESQIHRMPGEREDAGRAAADYEIDLRAAFAEAGRDDLTFDAMLLGVGRDAHIASLFPGSPLLAPVATRRPDRVAAVHVPHLAEWRLTLTPAAILDVRRTVVLVEGTEKADAVQAALALPEDVQRWPAQILRQLGGRVEWIYARGHVDT
jgi:6-phosphogluconolactonase